MKTFGFGAALFFLLLLFQFKKGRQKFELVDVGFKSRFFFPVESVGYYEMMTNTAKSRFFLLLNNRII